MQSHAVLEFPVYVRIPTEENRAYFVSKSSAEAVISTIVNAQNQGWMRLHGFVVLPDCLEMVMSPIRQGVAGVVAHIQSEMTPVLGVLLPEAAYVWSRYYSQAPIKTERSLRARLNMLLLAPVAQGIAETAEEYPYSSANPRYKANVAPYAGFSKAVPRESPVLSPEMGEAMLAAAASPTDEGIETEVPAKEDDSQPSETDAAKDAAAEETDSSKKSG